MSQASLTSSEAFDSSSPMAAGLSGLLDNAQLSPSKRQLIELLMAQQAAATSAHEAQAETWPDPEPTAMDPAPDYRLRAEHLRDALDAAQGRIDALEDLLESLADALGACPLCFGAEPGCRCCHGRGTPGATAPKREAFSFFVLPVLSRMKRRRPPGGPTMADESPRRPEEKSQRSE